MDTSARGKAGPHDDDAAAAEAAARFAAVMEAKFDFGKEEEEEAGGAELRSADELLPLQEHDSDLAFGAGDISF